MKLRSFAIATAGASFLLLSSAFAAGKVEKKSVTLVDPVAVGSTQLQPGDYKVEWTPGTPGSQVQLNILQHGKTVATTSAEVVENKTKSPQDDVVLRNVNGTKRLDEIDFAHKSEALVLHPNAVNAASGSGMSQ